MQGLCEAAPGVFEAAVREALQQQLASNQMEDKTRTCAALEMLCGMLAAGHVYTSGGDPAWDAMGSCCSCSALA